METQIEGRSVNTRRQRQTLRLKSVDKEPGSVTLETSSGRIRQIAKWKAGNNPAKKPPAFVPAASNLSKLLEPRGLSLPPVLEYNLWNSHRVKPLILGAHAEWSEWADEVGYTANDYKRLMACLRSLCISGTYRRALSKETSQRHDVYGDPVEKVSVEHRQAALAQSGRTT